MVGRISQTMFESSELCMDNVQVIRLLVFLHGEDRIILVGIIIPHSTRN